MIRKWLLKQPLFQIVVVFKWCYFSNTSLTSHFLKTFVKLCYNYIIPLVGKVWSVLMCWYQKYFLKNKNILFWCVSEKKITLKSNCFYAFKHPFSVLLGGVFLIVKCLWIAFPLVPDPFIVLASLIYIK